MKTTTLLAGLLAAAMAHGQTDTDAKPSALGVSEGDPVPADARPYHDEGVLRTAVLSSVAGLHSRAVVYTAKQGVCKVLGYVEVDNPQGDSFGMRHKAAADDLVARVKDKLNASPTTEYDLNIDTLFDALGDGWAVC